MNTLPRPTTRSRLRRAWGRRYYTLRRWTKWKLSSQKWARQRSFDATQHEVFTHRSLILRPLKDVQMYLQENKRANLRLAIQHLDGVVLQPGETFSLWRLVGRPTKRKGYLDGLVLNQGQIETGIGGGLCQLGNLLFWVFAHSPLTITERYRHGYDVFPDVNRKVPFGAGATLSYNYIDFQVTNETTQAFRIALWLDETHLNGRLDGETVPKETYRIEERDHQMKQQIWGGYTRHNRIVQVIEKPDGIQLERILAENHAIMMYSPFLESRN